MEENKDILDYTVLDIINICKDSTCINCKVSAFCDSLMDGVEPRKLLVSERTKRNNVDFTTTEIKLLKELFGNVKCDVYLYRDANNSLSWSIYAVDFDGHALPSYLFPSIPVGVCVYVNKYLK